VQRIHLLKHPRPVEEADVQRRRGVPHPETERLRPFVDEQHALVRTQIAPLHQAALHFPGANRELHPHDPIADLHGEKIRRALQRARGRSCEHVRRLVLGARSSHQRRPENEGKHRRLLHPRTPPPANRIGRPRPAFTSRRVEDRICIFHHDVG
jgi:hypothetical protein